MSKHEPQFPWLGLVIVIFVGVAIFLSQAKLEKDIEPGFTTLSIEFPDGSKRVFEGDVTYGTTLKDAISISASKGGFDFIYERNIDGDIKTVIIGETELEVEDFDNEENVPCLDIGICIEINSVGIRVDRVDLTNIDQGDEINIVIY
ncbi:MAG: hypothetical protein ABH833_02160 [Parcubacteria group bacterium]